VTRRQVLVLTKTTAMGGAERLLANALPHLDRRAFAYRLAAFDDDGPLADACRAHGVPFSALPHRSVLDPRNARALRRFLARDRVELLHAHLPLVGAVARVAARGLATRVVYTEHNTPEGYRRPTRWLNAATARWQTGVVAVSQEVLRCAPMGDVLTAVVPNGVDFEALEREAAATPDPPPPEPPGSLRILVPATLAHRKGPDVLVAALARWPRGGPPWVAWLAGEGPERERLLVALRAAGLDGRVHLLGRRGDVFALMRRADVVALPSRAEGHPLALLEAMALGRAVVASAVGGVPEIVRSGATGLLVPPARPEALREALLTLAADPALRARLGQAAGREARERFHVRRSVVAVEAVYRRALSLPLPGPHWTLALPWRSNRPGIREEGHLEALDDHLADPRARGRADRLRGRRGRRGRSVEELRRDP